MDKLNKVPLSTGDLSRLARICGLFSSAFEGERSNAAALADQFLRARGLRWLDVLAEPSLPAPAPPVWQQTAAACRSRSERLSRWEQAFLAEISNYQHPPSSKQADVLTKIAARVLSA